MSGKGFKGLWQKVIGANKGPKIICTLGTTTDDESVLRQMIEYGMAAARINTAYATIPEYKKRIEAVRRLAKIPIILDLKGSQIRLLTNNRYSIEPGEEFSVGFKAGDISFNYDFFEDISPGDIILFENGTIKTVVAEKKNRYLALRVIEAGEGRLRNHMGVNIPGKVFRNIPLLSEKDMEVIDFALKEKIEYLAISFVRKSEDVFNLADRLAGGNPPRIIIKIEDPVGAKNLQQIIRESRNRSIELIVMIGRGDLFVEAPKHRLPFIQKEIIKICKELSTEVIVATGLLESMQFNPYPTRSEVCDTANAVFDGADWLMLSAETSNSSYPAEAVKMLKSVIEGCQEYLKRQ
ncbi:MAG: hypothetical protein HYW69_00705 [Candidatus Nealsonbacteria bacterium]|nr:hypothetical protein [Candidatus Nealsonbacteria bacterium]